MKYDRMEEDGLRVDRGKKTAIKVHMYSVDNLGRADNAVNLNSGSK